MPSCTCTSQQIPLPTIASLAGQANAVSALLSVLEIISPDDRAVALAICGAMARDVSHALDQLNGGAA